MGKDESIIKPSGAFPVIESGRTSPSAEHDVEKQSLEQGSTQQLQRRLKSRHLQMIAIGGTIGTGLFIGSGGALAKAGPAGALIAYSFVGTLVLSVMVALGEMATFLPVAGSFTVYSSRFVEPSLGFAMGWIYWFSWAMTFALELVASGLIIQYWDSSISLSIFVGVFWVAIVALNFLPVSFYGEAEFWLALTKVVCVVGFIIFAICIDAGAGQHGYLGVKTWSSPGAFAEYLLPGSAGKAVGFFSTLIQAGFSYQGTELVGIAAGETADPRKNVPSAIRKTFWRIIIFFVLTILMIGLLVPYDNSSLLSENTDATASPFVISAQLAGVKVLPGLINGVLLVVVLSAANSNVYSGSRILVGLASEGLAPKQFSWTTNKGVPWVAVAFTSLFGLLGFMNESASATTVFDWLLNITGVAGFISWTCIGISHIAFMKALSAQNISRDSLPYKAFWQPWLSYYGVGFNILIILTQGFTAFIPWDVTSFFIAYISVILFTVMYVVHKLITKSRVVSSVDVDLITGRKEVDDLYALEEKTQAMEGEQQKTFLKRMSSWVLG